ncbi:MAG: M3 family oligoendopeptidase [Patescibacteria group bacterium]
MKKSPQNKKYAPTLSPEWDLKQLYASTSDPQIEADMQEIERGVSAFAQKYDTADKKYLSDATALAAALSAYENLAGSVTPKPLYYLFYANSLNSNDSAVSALMSLMSERASKVSNCLQFFTLALGSISTEKQKKFLKDTQLAPYRFMLECIFSDAKHKLSLGEEKVLALKKLPSKELWTAGNDKLLGKSVIKWQGKNMPLAQALNLISEQKTSQLRKKLALLVYTELKRVADFSEAEVNAVFIDKKIDDELRGFKTPYESTVREYRNDPAVIEHLVQTVTSNFHIAHKFHTLKARLLKQKKLNYWDRAAKIGVTKSTYSFQESLSLLRKTFHSIDPKYAAILDQAVQDRRIDASPRKGKQSGAYCSSSYTLPTFVLLNHVDTLNSLTTFAHEMGHAFHGELSRSQGPIYCEYSYALAETASTLFEAIAEDAVFETLSDKEKIIVLHDKINGDVATIFRQIACFNFELELHTTIRTKGFVEKEEICAIHNKNMQAYLGPSFTMIPDDGYMFASWSHIRRFFYVYSYAYGSLVSKALLRRYKQDPTFWNKIEIFLSAGGRDTPENILKEIGIDVSKPDFFLDGLKTIEEDIALLERLTSKK